MHLIFDTKFPRKRERERETTFLIEFREQHELILEPIILNGIVEKNYIKGFRYFLESLTAVT